MISRELIVAKLFDRIKLLGDANTSVYRNLDKPMTIPSGGMIILRDNEAAKETEVFLNPLTYVYELTVQLEVMIQHPDAATRGKVLDDLLVGVVEIIGRNRTLNNLVEWMEAKPPEFQDEAIEGAATVRSASVPIVIRFAASQISTN